MPDDPFLHGRERLTFIAAAELHRKAVEIMERHGLTKHEMLVIFTEQASGLARNLVLHDRHPELGVK